MKVSTRCFSHAIIGNLISDESADIQGIRENTKNIAFARQENSYKGTLNIYQLEEKLFEVREEMKCLKQLVSVARTLSYSNRNKIT